MARRAVVSGGRWPRDGFAEAVWTSNLPPSQRLVALAFADHAHDKDEAWLTYDRLQERTGLSRDTVARHLRGLIAAGWLVLLRRRRCGSGVYRLAVPARSDGRTSDQAQESGSRTAGGRWRSDGAAQQSDASGRAVRRSDSTSIPTRVPTSTAASANGPGEGEEDADRRAAGELLAALPVPVALTAGARGALRACLVRGWPVSLLVQAVAEPSWAGVTHPPAVLEKRLAQCAQQSAPRLRTSRPSWCGGCNQRTRLIDEDRPRRCPLCHPASLAGVA